MKRSEMQVKLGSFLYNFRHRIIQMTPGYVENIILEECPNMEITVYVKEDGNE